MSNMVSYFMYFVILVPQMSFRIHHHQKDEEMEEEEEI